MRQRIVSFLNERFHTHVFEFVVPGTLFVYLMMAVAMCYLFSRRCRERSLPIRHKIGILSLVIFVGLVGGHLFFVLQNISYMIRHPAVIFDLTGDSVSFGVYSSGTLAVLIYTRYARIALAPLLDTIASVIGMGPFIGRMACFLNGDDYGSLSSLPWAVRYPSGSYPFSEQLSKGLTPASASLSLPIHPVQLYESFIGLVLFILFSVLWTKNIFKPGILFLFFWMAYALSRFVLEIFRGDDRGFVGPLSIGQYCCVLIFSFACIFLRILYDGNIMMRAVQFDL